MNDINSVLINGRAMGPLTIYPTEKPNSSETTFVLGVLREGRDGEHAVCITVRCHGRLAETIAMYVHLGTLLRINGYLEYHEHEHGGITTLEVVAQCVDYRREPA